MEALSSQLEYRRPGPSLNAAPRLRLILDARKIEDGGIGIYIQNLIHGLCQRPNIDLTLIARSAAALSSFDWSKQVRVIEDLAPSYSFDEMFLMARRIDWRFFDLYHSPHFTLPYGIKIPSVVTIHDLIHLHHPEKSYYPLVAKAMIMSALKRSARVLTVSHSTYLDLSELAGQRQDLKAKIQVVPNALDPFFLENLCEREESAQYVGYRYGLRSQFLLAVVSNAKPHKGILDLLKAFASIRDLASAGKLPRSARDLKLVLVGQGSESLVFKEEVLEQAGSIRGVHLLGQVSRSDLLHLYAAASALVVPSLAEGFCLPVIEAQAMGTAVIARPVPAVKELLSDNDLVCADFSVEALRSALVSFIKQPRDYSAAGQGPILRRNSDRFLVKDVTRAVLQVYNQALAH